MSLLLAMIANAAIADIPTEATSRDGKPTLYCRNMVVGASKSGDIAVCKTKAAWADWDSCQGVTRYCSPAQKAAMRAKYTAFALNEDSRIVCRIVNTTGSRLSSRKLCMAQREWQRMWDDSREETRNYQDYFSKKPNGGQ